MDNVYLIGMMATGKSTVGRAVAEELGLKFRDTDDVIEARAGADISWIFDREGEAGFRDREESVLDELTLASGVLLATGGGVVLRPKNRERLRRRGTVVYLHTPPAVIALRVRGDRKRPLLQAPDLAERIEVLCRDRDPLYRETAHFVVNGGQGSPRLVAAAVAQALASWSSAGNQSLEAAPEHPGPNHDRSAHPRGPLSEQGAATGPLIRPAPACEGRVKQPAEPNATPSRSPCS